MCFFFVFVFGFFKIAWGKGPVQGKIHGHPEYIDEGFPLTDKFLLCTVKRTTSGTGDDEEENDDAVAMTDDETNDDEQTESPTDKQDISNKEADNSNVGEALRRRRRVGQGVGKGKEDFFAVPQDKLGRMKSRLKHVSSNATNSSFGLIVVVILALIVMVVLYVSRGRKKITKRN